MLFSTPDELIAECKTLPQSPLQLLQLLRLLENPNNALEPLVTIVRGERGLAAKVVHLANSPVYAASGPCGSIEEAVSRLGFVTVHNAVTTLLGLLPFAQPLRVYPVTTTEMWRQSITTALAARELAALTGEDQPRAYTLGLLSGIGMVAIDRWIWPRVMGKQFAREAWPEEWRGAEIRVLGFDQAEAGAAMLRAWSFPREMAEGLRYEFRPAAARGDAQRLATLLNVACWIRHAFFTEARAGAVPECAALPLLGLPASEVPPLVQKISGEFDRAWERFGLGETAG